MSDTLEAVMRMDVPSALLMAFFCLMYVVLMIENR